MTPTQASELSKALERAHARGVRVLGKGRRKADGAVVFLVSSSQPGKLHQVTVLENRLACDCPASQYHPNTPCAHRAVTHERLLEERAKADADREAQDAERARAAHLRDTAPIYRDNKPFSIWK